MEIGNAHPLTKARADLADVRREIAELQAREKKLAQFVELGVELYGEQSGLPPQETEEVFLANPIQTGSAGSGRKLPMKRLVIGFSKEAITQSGPKHTRDLIAYIEGKGVSISGSSKLTTISKILSQSSEFTSDRTTGWSLVIAQSDGH
jgi:hypothetical protein